MALFLFFLVLAFAAFVVGVIYGATVDIIRKIYKWLKS